MKGRELPRMSYRNCSSDSGGVQCVAMKVRGLDFQSVRRLPPRISGNSPRGALGVGRSSCFPSASARGRLLLRVGSDSMRSDTSLFLGILESVCLGIMDSILLDWIWPFAWAYFVLVGDYPRHS